MGATKPVALPEGFEVESLPEGFEVEKPAERQRGPVERFLRGAIVEPVQSGLELVRRNVSPSEEPNLMRRLAGPGAGIAQDIGAGLLQSQMGEGAKFERALKEGQPVEAVSRFLTAGIPVIGPIAGQIADRIRSGDVAGGAGELSGVLASSFGGMRRIKPVDTGEIFKAIKPIKTQRVIVEKALPGAVEELKAAGKAPESLIDLKQSVQEIRLTVGKEIEGTLARNQGKIIDGKTLADSIRGSVDKFSELTDKAKVKRVRELADDIEANFKDMTLSDAEALRQHVNSELGLFFRKGDIAKREALSDPNIAARLVLRESLEGSIETALANESLKGIRRRYHNLRSVEDAVHNQILDQMVKEDPKLLNLSSLDTITAGGAIASFLSGNPQAGVALTKVVAARRAIVLMEEKFRNPNARIRRAFRGAPKTSASILRILGPVLFGQEEESGRSLKREEGPVFESLLK